MNNVVSIAKGDPPYSNVSKNFADLVKGSYGKTPWPIDPEFRFKICGTREEIPYDTSNYKKQNNPVLPEAGGARLALNEKEELLLELFPSVAERYLKNKRIAEWKAAHPDGVEATKNTEPATTPVASDSNTASASNADCIDLGQCAPAFSSLVAPLDKDYCIDDGLDSGFWENAINNAE